LTNTIKKSIIWKGGTVFLVSVLKRFRTFTKTLSISSLSNSMKKNGFLARKDPQMKTVFSATRGRFATTLALVTALVACGGGGGGGSTPAPTPTTVTVTCPDGTTQTAESATIANTACPAPTLVSSSPANGNLSVSPLAVATDGIVIVTSSVLESLPTTVSLNDGSTDLAGVITAVNTKSIKFVPTATLLYGHVYTLVTTVRDNVGKPLTVNISFTTVNISCPTPQVPSVNGQSCVDPAPTVLHYTDKVYAIWDSDYLYTVNKTGATMLVNKTSFTTGLSPIFNCWVSKASGVLADGKILVSCQDTSSLRRHYLYIDPTKDELYEYTGQTPANLTCTENVDKTWTCPADNDWENNQSVPPVGAPADALATAHVSDGWYFSTNTEQRTIFFADSLGNTSTVKVGLGGVVKMLMTFSH
jgi:hypothetical protein